MAKQVNSSTDSKKNSNEKSIKPSQNEKKELKAQKKAEKQAKKDAALAKKSSIKWIPLAVFILLIVALYFLTDFLTGLTVKLVAENIFGARCDIEKVHFDWRKSSLEISGFQVGNKSAPMTNLFQFDHLVCDININQMLQKRAIIDEMTVTGIAVGTPRSQSAYIKPKEKKQTSRDKREFTPISLPQFDYQSLLKDLAAKISDGVMQALPVSDAQQLLYTLQNELQTPGKTSELMELTATLTDKWQNKQNEISSKISDFSNSAKKAQSISLNENSSIQEIQTAITQLTSVYNEGNALQKEIKTSYNQIQSDSKKVSNVLSSFNTTIASDKKKISKSVNTISNELQLNASFFNEITDSIWTNIVGEAGPYLEQGKKILAYLSAKNGTKKEKPEQHARLSGTTYTWGVEYPEVYIGRLYFSGFGFTGEFQDITNNQYITRKATTGFLLHRNDGFEDSISLVVDTRGKEFTEDQFTADIFWNSPVSLSVPQSFNGTMTGASMSYAFSSNETSRFHTNGSFSDVSIIPPSTGQSTVDRILARSLSNFDSVSASLSWSSDSQLRSSTNLPALIKNKASIMLKEESEALSAEINQKAGELLANYIETATGSSAQFNTLVEAYDAMNDLITNIQVELNKKIDEYKKQASDAATAAAKEAASAAGKAAQNALNSATEKAGNSLKGLFGR